ncbi:MAG: PTS sugar transporter subunit IIA [Phycisphaerales bacterium]|nr:PTS sugar transporter subunit IIA [Phycisphaerales bacterium]
MSGEHCIRVYAGHPCCPAATRDGVLMEIARLANTTFLSGISVEVLHARLHEREELGPTSTPEGVAFPHAILPEIDSPGLVIVTTAAPVLFGPHHIRIAVGLFADTKEPWRHVRTLARVARICSRRDAREAMLSETDAGELCEFFKQECNRDG